MYEKGIPTMSTSRVSTTSHRTRVFLALTIALLTLGLAVGSAAAAPSPKSPGAFAIASAYAYGCTSEDGVQTCIWRSVFVRSIDEATIRVCAVIETSTYQETSEPSEPTYSREEGCQEVAAEAFTFDAKRLGGATLAPVTVTVIASACDENGCTDTSRDVSVSGTWTGTGDIFESRNKMTTEYDGCRYTSMGTSQQRQAEAIFTIDGQTFEVNDAYLVVARERFRSTCD